MVVRKLLACTQSNGHETSTALWNSYCRVSSRARLAQIRFSRGAHAKNHRPPFWFYEESIRTSVFSHTATTQHCTKLHWHCGNVVYGAHILQEWKLAEGGLPLLVYYIYNCKLYTIIRPITEVYHGSVSHKQLYYIIMYRLEIDMFVDIRRNFLRSAQHPQ